VNTPAVVFDQVSASRGGRRVLKDVSLTVGAREIVALVGRSGSGKTTLLRLVNRLIQPDSGRVLVDNRDVADWDPISLRRRTGYVIQEAGLFPHLTVAANIATVPTLLQWDPIRIRARVDELLSLVGLDPAEFSGRWPDQLSGGQRQRVGLARALAADPPLLLMDEPFGAVDPITRHELHAEFIRVQAAIHRAVILVTHDIAEACALADRVAALHEGELVAVGTPAQLAASTDPRISGLLGST
jgi:osmoprotectant transport system ATP-binding protein